MKKLLPLSLGLCFLMQLSACKKADQASTPTAKKEVNLAIWSNFVTPQMIATFETQSGLKVNISNYSSNEELLAKLQAGASGIDVAVPADYMVFAMSQMGLLEKLDQAKISSFADLDAKLKSKEFDPKNEFSMPWDWGTTGIAVNRKLYKGEVKGWNQVLNAKDLNGKFTLLDDVRETLGMALKVNGFSLNATDPAQIEKAQATLSQARKSVKAFTSETLMGLLHDEMAVGHAYSSDALQARAKTNGQIDYLIPEEGCTLWIDTLVIPKGAQNVEGAYQLINYLLSTEVSAERTKNIMVAPSNTKAMALLPEDLKTSTALFPSDAQLSKCESIKDIGDGLRVWDKAWTALKASAK